MMNVVIVFGTEKQIWLFHRTFPCVPQGCENLAVNIGRSEGNGARETLQVPISSFRPLWQWRQRLWLEDVRPKNPTLPPTSRRENLRCVSWFYHLILLLVGGIPWYTYPSGIPTPLKNDGVRQLWWFHSQYDGKVIIQPCSSHHQPGNIHLPLWTSRWFKGTVWLTHVDSDRLNPKTLW